MRNYLYISDAKVDVYLPQITAGEKKKVAARLGFNVGVLQGSLQMEQMSLESRVHRLVAVEQKLRAEKSVGSLESGEPWIEGTATVTAATFRDHEDVMFFFSNGEDHFLGLAGSAHHIVGHVRPETATSSFSHVHSLIDTLEAVTTSYAFVVDNSDEMLSDFVHAGVSQAGSVSSWTRIMNQISTQFDNKPKQAVTFLARRLTFDEIGPDGKRFTLATPLYMALDEVA